MMSSGHFSFLIYTACLIALLAGQPGHVLMARPPDLDHNKLNHHPSKIIRSCCVFGTDLRLGFIPFLRRTDIISKHELGQHQYLGNRNEGNGIIYTTRGGFIDVAHLRDIADWTGYLYNLITARDSTSDGIAYDLGIEGGEKTLTLHLPSTLDQHSTVELAGLIAYEISVWHEIASWFGISYLPLIPERYSSFSPEDLYSNLMGVHLGMRAIQSDLPYNEAMTTLISSMLDSLGAVETANDTYLAMKKVEGIWWSNSHPLPSRKILLSRYVETDDILLPWRLIEDNESSIAYPLEKPARHLKDAFELNITVRWPYFQRTEACLNSRKTITQNDFGELISCISDQVRNLTENSIQRKK